MKIVLQFIKNTKNHRYHTYELKKMIQVHQHFNRGWFNKNNSGL